MKTEYGNNMLRSIILVCTFVLSCCAPQMFAVESTPESEVDIIAPMSLHIRRGVARESVRFVEPVDIINVRVVTEVSSLVDVICQRFSQRRHGQRICAILRRVIPASIPSASVSVTLNRDRIVRPWHLRRQLSLSVPLELAAHNRLRVVAFGMKDSDIHVSVRGTPVPQLSVVSNIVPAANASGWHTTLPVTIEYTCDSGSVVLEECSGTQVIDEEIHEREIIGIARDVNGNEEQVVDVLKIDATPPAFRNSILNEDTPRVPVIAFDIIDPVAFNEARGSGLNLTSLTAVLHDATGDHDITVQLVSTILDQTLGSYHVTWTPSAALLDDVYTVTFSVADIAGNTTTPLVFAYEINLDPPVISTLTVNPDTVTNNGRPSFDGTVLEPAAGVDDLLVTFVVSVDDQRIDVTDDVTVTALPAPQSGIAFHFQPALDLPSGNYTFEVTARDVADNGATADVSVIIDKEVPVIVVSAPAEGALFGVDAQNVTVVGTLDDPAATVFINSLPVEVQADGSFTVDIPLVSGVNNISVVAHDSAGNAGVAVRTLVKDDQPPTLHIEFPASEAQTTAATTSVVGFVNDLELSEVNSAHLSVTVNGIVAAVHQRTFVVELLPLIDGANQITAIATDAGGNTAQTTTTITKVPVRGHHGVIVSGNNQMATTGAAVAEDLVVQVSDVRGQPVVNVLVTFSVSRGDGIMPSSTQDGQRLVRVLTDANGIARAAYTLGNRAGAALHRVRADITGSNEVLEFCFQATPGEPAGILVLSGNQQRGYIDSELLRPSMVSVIDARGNACADIDLTFTSTEGSALVHGMSEATFTTNADGRVATRWTLGPDTGLENNVIEVRVTDNTDVPRAVLRASAFEPGTETTFEGLVLSATFVPIVGATISVDHSSITTITDANGQFTLGNMPVGHQHLIIDGSTATAPAGILPTLAFDVDVLADIPNSLPMPIYLPLMDNSGMKLVGGATEETLGIQEMGDGYQAVIAPMSTFLKDGTQVAVNMYVSQVSSNAVPMPPPNGSAPLLAASLQPPGIHFNPPAQLIVANMTGQLPGAQVEMVSFDHDLGKFVVFGTGTVSEDGATIASDPGMGILKSGWHFPLPPPPPPAEVKSVTGIFQEVTVANVYMSLDNPLSAAVKKPKYYNHQVATPLITLNTSASVADDEKVTLVGTVVSTLDYVLGAGNEASQVVVIVEGEEVTINPDGSFSVEVPLYEESQYVGVTAYNILGGVATDRVFVDGITITHDDAYAHAPKPVYHRFYLGALDELPDGILATTGRVSVLSAGGNERSSFPISLKLRGSQVYTEAFLVSPHGGVYVDDLVANAQSHKLALIEDINDNIRLSYNGSTIALVEQAGLICNIVTPRRGAGPSFSPGSYHSVGLDEDLKASGSTVRVEMRNVVAGSLIGTIRGRIEEIDAGDGTHTVKWNYGLDGKSAKTDPITVMFGRHDIKITAKDKGGAALSCSFSSFIADGDEVYRDLLIVPGALSEAYDDVVLIRVPAALGDQRLCEVMRRLDCVVVANEAYGSAGEPIETRLLWIHPHGNRDRNDVMTELTSDEIGIHIEYETFLDDSVSMSTSGNSEPSIANEIRSPAALAAPIGECIAQPNPPGPWLGGEDFNIVDELKGGAFTDSAQLIKRLRRKKGINPIRSERIRRGYAARVRMANQRRKII